MTRTRTLALACVCCVCGAAVESCTRGQGQSNNSAAAPASVPSSVTCLGKIVPGEGIVRIAAPESSVIRAIRVNRGSVVGKGDTLAILDGYDSAVAAMKEAEGQVSVAQSALDQAKAPDKPAAIAAQEAAIARQQSIMDNAEIDYKRRKQLFDDHLISAADFESTELNLRTARESFRRETELLANLRQVRDVDVDYARKKLAAAIAARDHASADLERQIIRAPLSATVLEIYARAGEAPGSTGVLDLGDTAHMFVEAEVYASDIKLVHIGAAAIITGEAFEGALTGHVAEILREAGYSALFPVDPSNAADKRVVRVRVQLDDSARVSSLSNSQVQVRIRI